MKDTVVKERLHSDGEIFIGNICSRNPLTGVKNLYGQLWSLGDSHILDIKDLPKSAKQDLAVCLQKAEKLEKFPVSTLIEYFPDKQKFNVLNNKRAKLVTEALLKALFDLEKEKIISSRDILKEFPLDSINELFTRHLENAKKNDLICKGTPISYGAGSGILLNNKTDIKEALLKGKDIIWILEDVASDDFQLFDKVQAVILANVGQTSHAAVIARGLGKPAISGCREILSKNLIGKKLTVDANSGKVYKGEQKIYSGLKNSLSTDLLRLAKKASKIKLRVNADNSTQAAQGILYGAEGVGLCRTEHMFTDSERAHDIRYLLFSNGDKKEVLNRIQRHQEKDFKAIFEALDGCDIIVRYLDAPLHEFLPKTKEGVKTLAKRSKVSMREMEVLLETMREDNPMLGFRGARMLLYNKDIIRVQTRAILAAYSQLDGKKPTVKIEIPLVSGPEEVRIFREVVETEVADSGVKNFKYKVGAMLETPRACLLVAEIAKIADFLSFGTNDLSQLLYGFSRDDGEAYINYYIENRIIESNPFSSIDPESLGAFMADTVAKAKRTNPNIELSICGEQASDPSTIDFLVTDTQVDSISMNSSAFPKALLAVAKSSLK